MGTSHKTWGTQSRNVYVVVQTPHVIPPLRLNPLFESRGRAVIIAPRPYGDLMSNGIASSQPKSRFPDAPEEP